MKKTTIKGGYRISSPEAKLYIDPVRFDIDDFYIPDWVDKNIELIKEKPAKGVLCVDGKRYPEEEVFYIDGSYFHKSSPDIFVDDFDGSVEHKGRMCTVSKKLVFKGNKLVKHEHGYVKKSNLGKCIPIFSNENSFEGRVISLDCIEGWDYKEDFSNGNYVDKSFKSKSIDTIKYFEQFKNYIQNSNDIKTKLMIGAVSPSFLSTAGLKYKFGVEIEVSRGFIPSWKAHRMYNISCVRDGSVNAEEGGGGEYVTGILTGDTGVNHLQNICLELSKRTKVNKSCGIHLHLGGFDFTKQFLVNSYRLALLLEDEIFSTLPESRRNNPYCKRLKKFKFDQALNNSIDNKISTEESYNQLFKYISYEEVNNPTFDYNKSKQHPLGAKCGYNKETPRYCWINYVPAMFNTRLNDSYSIEIRSHHGSTNFNKIKNWLLFFMSFVAFAEKYPELIVEGITMDDVINKIMPLKAKSMIDYFNSKKQLFSISKSEDIEYSEVNIAEEKKTIKELINN